MQDGGAPGAADAAGEGEDEARYMTRIEEAFIAERGTPFLLSSKDVTLTFRWRERGIPADTVIRAVKETFQKRRARGDIGKIGSISYCANAVDELWEMERRGLVGKGEGARDVAPAHAGDGLTRVATALAAAAEVVPDGLDGALYRTAVARALEKLRALSPAAPYDELEDALLAIEVSLLRALKKAQDEASAAELARRVDADLGELPGVAAAVVERTRRALERRELRRSCGLPALTLFQ